MSMVEWKAVYTDGNSLSQYNKGDGIENKYTNIDRSRLSQFILFADGNPKVIISLNDNKRLIYRKRIAMSFAGANAGNQETVYLAGWQEERQGINIQMICFLFEDGHIEITDKFEENHSWFYPVIFLPEEKTERDKKNEGN